MHSEKSTIGISAFFKSSLVLIIVLTTFLITATDKYWNIGIIKNQPREEGDKILWNAFRTQTGPNVTRHRNNTPPPLYIITPTWPRPVQIPELTRLGYTLKVIAKELRLPASKKHLK